MWLGIVLDNLVLFHDLVTCYIIFSWLYAYTGVLYLLMCMKYVNLFMIFVKSKLNMCTYVRMLKQIATHYKIFYKTISFRKLFHIQTFLGESQSEPLPQVTLLLVFSSSKHVAWFIFSLLTSLTQILHHHLHIYCWHERFYPNTSLGDSTAWVSWDIFFHRPGLYQWSNLVTFLQELHKHNQSTFYLYFLPMWFP